MEQEILLLEIGMTVVQVQDMVVKVVMVMVHSKADLYMIH